MKRILIAIGEIDVDFRDKRVPGADWQMILPVASELVDNKDEMATYLEQRFGAVVSSAFKQSGS